MELGLCTLVRASRIFMYDWAVSGTYFSRLIRGAGLLSAQVNAKVQFITSSKDYQLTLPY